MDASEIEVTVGALRIRQTVALVLLPLLLATACFGRDEPPAPPPTPSDTVAPPPPPPATPTEPEVRLDERFYVDSDGNAIPDFIEEQLGYDPLVDDCAAQGGCALPQGIPGATPTADQNVLVILDSSGSMAGPANGGQLKIDAARQAIERYVVGTPDNYDLGLMVYGHIGSNEPQDKAVSCAGIDVFAPLGDLTVDNVGATLARFGPNGYTPIAASLDRAADVFTGTEGASNRVVLVTDGVETCDGDPIASARHLKESNIAVTVDVVGFDIEGSAQEAALRAVASATGGTYTPAQDAAQLNAYFEDLLGLQADLLEAINCVRRQGVDLRGCRSQLSSVARSRLEELEDQEPDDERASLINDLSLRINARTSALNDQTFDTTVAGVEELQGQLDEARKRYQERFGEEISMSFTCLEPTLFA